MLNFLQMQYFMAVAESGSFSAASRKMHISQQALSSQISQIESEIGVRLFERTHPLTITEAGQKFYEASSQILYIRHTLDLNLEDLSTAANRRIRLGVSSAYTRTFLPSILPKYYKKYPDVKIELFESTWASVYDLLMNRKADMILAQPPADQSIISVPVSSAELTLYAPREALEAYFGERAGQISGQLRKEVLLSALETCPMILPRTGNVRSHCNQLFLSQHYVPNILIETEFLETAVTLCQTGLGITFAPRDFMDRLEPGNRTRRSDIYRLKASPYHRTLSLCYLKQTPLSQAMEGLIQVFRDELS